MGMEGKNKEHLEEFKLNTSFFFQSCYLTKGFKQMSDQSKICFLGKHSQCLGDMLGLYFTPLFHLVGIHVIMSYSFIAND